MFKKILLLSFFIPALSWAAPLGDSIGPATSTNTITIAAPGAGKINCLTHVSFDVSNYGANTATFRMLDGTISATTTYQLITSTTTGFNTPPLVVLFNAQDPYCASVNSAIQLKNSANTFDINYQGYVRQVQ